MIFYKSTMIRKVAVVIPTELDKCQYRKIFCKW